MFISTLKCIKTRNGWLSSILISLLYLEISVPKLVSIWLKILRVLLWQPVFNLQIPPVCFTKKSICSLRLPHPFMIIIHPKCKIGEMCTIFHEVTLGCIEQKSQQAPILERNVYIGCKTACLGEVNLGENCIVGACSMVLSSTPPIAKLLDYTNKRKNF